MTRLVVLVLLLLLALACLVSAQEAVETLKSSPTPSTPKKKIIRKRWTEKRCDLYRKISCEFVSKCVKAGIKCIKEQKSKTCAHWQRKVNTKRIPYCAKYKWVRTRKECADRKRVCAATKYRVIKTVKHICTKHVEKRSCLKHKRVCKQRKTIKRCYRVEGEYKLSGPKSCPKGQRLKFSRKGKSITRSCIQKEVTKAPLRTCVSQHDPHYVTLHGWKTDFHFAGDYNLYESPDGVFSVHQRLQRRAHYSTNVGFAVRPNGHDILEYSNHHFKLNGKPFAVPKNGQEVVFPQAGSVKVQGKLIEVFGANGVKLIVHDYKDFLNLFVAVPLTLVPNARGICSMKGKGNVKPLPVAGLFSTRYRSRFIAAAYPDKHWANKNSKASATERCRKLGLRGVKVDWCVKDLLFITNPKLRKILFKSEKEAGKDAKTVKKVKSVTHGGVTPAAGKPTVSSKIVLKTTKKVVLTKAQKKCRKLSRTIKKVSKKAVALHKKAHKKKVIAKKLAIKHKKQPHKVVLKTKSVELKRKAKKLQKKATHKGLIAQALKKRRALKCKPVKKTVKKTVVKKATKKTVKKTVKKVTTKKPVKKVVTKKVTTKVAKPVVKKVTTKKAAPKKQVIKRVIVKKPVKKVVVKKIVKPAVKKIAQIKAVAKKGRKLIIAAAKKFVAKKTVVAKHVKKVVVKKPAKKTALKKVKQIKAVAKKGRSKIIAAANKFLKKTTKTKIVKRAGKPTKKVVVIKHVIRRKHTHRRRHVTRRPIRRHVVKRVSLVAVARKHAKKTHSNRVVAKRASQLRSRK